MRKVYAYAAFNKVLKAFMNFPSAFSPSWLFVACDILNFPPLRRKLELSFMKVIETIIQRANFNLIYFFMTNVMQR